MSTKPLCLYFMSHPSCTHDTLVVFPRGLGRKHPLTLSFPKDPFVAHSFPNFLFTFNWSLPPHSPYSPQPITSIPDGHTLTLPRKTHYPPHAKVVLASESPLFCGVPIHTSASNWSYTTHVVLYRHLLLSSCNNSCSSRCLPVFVSRLLWLFIIQYPLELLHQRVLTIPDSVLDHITPHFPSTRMWVYYQL